MTTQFAKASYQEIIDLHTESDKVSVIGIHTPTSDTPRKMFGGFFDQFKKFKYLGCSISLVPAARLPADPLQVSYEAGEATIDPRDMLNPLMFHGCHGNDMGAILNRLYALNSIDAKKMDSIFQYEADTDDTIDVNGFQLEDLYYKALTDNTWKKAHPQRGFKKSGLRPLVYSMATNHQLLGASALRLNNGNVIMQSTQGLPLEVDYESGTGTVDLYSNVSQSDIRFFTPRLTGLGWLDTRNAITSSEVMEDVTVDATLDDVHAALAQINANQQSEPDLPLVYMGMILLPPAYKTEQYFRMIVNHHFAFKEFRGISFSNTLINTSAYGNFNDDDWTQGGDTVNPDNPDDGSGSGGDGGDISGTVVVTYRTPITPSASVDTTLIGTNVSFYKNIISEGGNSVVTSTDTGYRAYVAVSDGVAYPVVVTNSGTLNSFSGSQKCYFWSGTQWKYLTDGAVLSSGWSSFATGFLKGWNPSMENNANWDSTIAVWSAGGTVTAVAADF